MTLSDDEKHELRMRIGSGSMAMADLATEDSFLEDVVALTDAAERLVGTMRAHDMQTSVIAGMLTGLALQPLVRGIDQ